MQSPVAATALGTATLSATLGLIGVIPCLGWLVQLAASNLNQREFRGDEKTVQNHQGDGDSDVAGVG